MEEQPVVQSEAQTVSSKTQPDQGGDEEKIVKQLTPSNKKGFLEVILPALIILMIILAGVGTGYFLVNRGGVSLPGVSSGGGGSLTGGPKEAGLKDADSFPDKAQGKIEVNQDKEMPEGSHMLIRPGGESQTAYLTSSLVDLNEFKGKCVEVWGETFAAQKAGWFMDIGFIQKIDQCPEGI